MTSDKRRVKETYCADLLVTRHWSLPLRHSPPFHLTISKYILIACPPRGAASLAPKPPG